MLLTTFFTDKEINCIVDMTPVKLIQTGDQRGMSEITVNFYFKDRWWNKDTFKTVTFANPELAKTFEQQIIDYRADKIILAKALEDYLVLSESGYNNFVDKINAVHRSSSAGGRAQLQDIFDNLKSNLREGKQELFSFLNI